MALPTVADVYALARSKAGDSTSSPEWMTDAVILPVMNEAYRFAARFLRSTGMGLLRKISPSTGGGLLAVTSGASSLARAALPTDFIRPYEIRERATTGPGAWTPMSQSPEGFFPERAATATLDLWDWREDVLYFNVANRNNDIQVIYEASLPELTTTASSILIVDGVDPLAKLLASYMLISRDEKEYAKYLEESAIKDLSLIAEGEKKLKLSKGGRWPNA